MNDELTQAIRELAKELKRYNDANEPPIWDGKSTTYPTFPAPAFPVPGYPPYQPNLPFGLGVWGTTPRPCIIEEYYKAHPEDAGKPICISCPCPKCTTTCWNACGHSAP